MKTILSSIVIAIILMGCDTNSPSSPENEGPPSSDYPSETSTATNKNAIEASQSISPFYSIDYLGNNPSKKDYDYVDGVQGLANNGAFWYLANKTEIYGWNASWGFPSNLPTYPDRVHTGMPSEISPYNHFGDLDYKQDQHLLYVPLEFENDFFSLPPKLVVFDSQLHYIDSEVLSKNDVSSNDKAPWLSVHPTSGEIYTSKFDNVTELWIYQDQDSSPSLNLSYSRRLLLKKSNGSTLELDQIQGGEFAESGHLFLYVENSYGSSAGIYVIDINTGKRLNFKQVEIDGGVCWEKQEFEGITIWDLDSEPYNGGIEGNVHAMLWEPNTTCWGEKFWLKHFRTSPAVN